jgi:hypothetical protein
MARRKPVMRHPTALVALLALGIGPSVAHSEELSAPGQLFVAQVDYGPVGTVEVSWQSPEVYDRVEVSVDGVPAEVGSAEGEADGTAERALVPASPGRRSFSVRGVQGDRVSAWATAEFDVLAESPLPRPVSTVACEYYPLEGGWFIVSWETGSDAWVSGRLEVPGYSEVVPIEESAVEAWIAARPDEPRVARLVFRNAEGYDSPAFMPLCIQKLPAFRRGDCDGTGRVNITDVVYELDHLFKGGRRWACDDACDANDDGSVNISDPIASLQYLFQGAGPLPSPGPRACGVDLTDDLLGGLCTCP